MIRSLSRLVLLLSLSTLLVQCSKKEETPSPAAAVQGEWRITAFSASPAIPITTQLGVISASEILPLVYLSYPCAQQVTFTVTSDRVRMNTPSGCNFTAEVLEQTLGFTLDGTYRVDGNKLIFTSSNGQSTTYDLVVSGNTMTWTAPAQVANPNNPAAPVSSTFTFRFEKR